MPSRNRPDHIITAILIFVALVAAGLLGNFFKFTIFLQNVDFIFGSIFALLALQRLGYGPGVAAALLISGYTYFLWNHPYAIIIMTAEVAVVGLLISRRRVGMVLADTLFWLFIGIPLIYLFYHQLMGTAFSNTAVIMVKQAMNGIFNALIARLLFSACPYCSRDLEISFREIIYNLLAFFVLVPSLAMMTMASRADFAETDRQTRTALLQDLEQIDSNLEAWIKTRATALTFLADRAAVLTPEQMSPLLEQSRLSDSNFHRIRLLDSAGVSVAASPETAEDINRCYADRPHISTLQNDPKLMLSEVAPSKVDPQQSRLLLLAPVLRQGTYSGYIAGNLNLDEIKLYLDKSTQHNDSHYLLLDKDDRIILTNCPAQQGLDTLKRTNGTLAPLDNGILKWRPKLPPNTPAVERWKTSRYVAESSIGPQREWKLVLEQPLVPYQKILAERFYKRLFLLFGLLLATLAIAELVSRKAVKSIEKLRHLTDNLPLRLASGVGIDQWPSSSVLETKRLIANFKEMSHTIAGQMEEIKKVNLSLERRVEERMRERDTFYAFFQTAADLMCIADPNGSFKQVNPACTEILGYSEAELITRPFLDFIHEDDKQETLDEMARQLQTGSSLNFENRYLRKDGSICWLSWRAIYNAGERTTYATGRDVTEQKQLLEELRRTKEDAVAASIAKSRFLANMSHEIRTPMNGVIGMNDLLLDSDLDPSQRECAELAKASGKDLMRLINDILDLSKIEAHRIELETEPFDLRKFVVATAELFAAKASKKGLALDWRIAADVPLLLEGDDVRLRQIISNLLSNAIKFTKKGGVSLAVTQQGVGRHQVTLRFEVRDSGIGISQEKMQLIFEPFAQAEASTTRHYGGTGLGLAICKQLAELLGGEIGAESVAGEGATFWFTAVFARQPVDERRTGSNILLERRAAVVTRPYDGHAPHLLLVEDDPTNQAVIRAILSSNGYRVDLAASGRKAIQLLEQNDYDLVLMDCKMPDMDGYQTTATIRNLSSAVRNHRIAVIALTANAMKEDRDLCLQAGMDDYLAKPVEMAELLHTLEKWLGYGTGPTEHMDSALVDEIVHCDTPPAI